jgi:hypothetical protein
VNIYSDPYQVRPLDTLALSNDLADWASTARPESIFSATQDDHGILANIVTREARSCRDNDRNYIHRRATSMPPIPVQNRDDKKHTPLESTLFFSGSTYFVHRCGSDLRWRCLAVHHETLRECLQSHNPWSTHQQSTPQGWELDILYDRKHAREARWFAERFYLSYINVIDETAARVDTRT